MPEWQVLQKVFGMADAKFWEGKRYRLGSRNCVNFADALTRAIKTSKRVPPKLNRLARALPTTRGNR